MIICSFSLGLFGVIIFLIIGYILIKAVIGIIKGMYHGFMKLIGRE